MPSTVPAPIELDETPPPSYADAIRTSAYGLEPIQQGPTNFPRNERINRLAWSIIIGVFFAKIGLVSWLLETRSEQSRYSKWWYLMTLMSILNYWALYFRDLSDTFRDIDSSHDPVVHLPLKGPVIGDSDILPSVEELPFGELSESTKRGRVETIVRSRRQRQSLSFMIIAVELYLMVLLISHDCTTHAPLEGSEKYAFLSQFESSDSPVKWLSIVKSGAFRITIRNVEPFQREIAGNLYVERVVYDNVAKTTQVGHHFRVNCLRPGEEFHIIPEEQVLHGGQYVTVPHYRSFGREVHYRVETAVYATELNGMGKPRRRACLVRLTEQFEKIMDL